MRAIKSIRYRPEPGLRTVIDGTFDRGDAAQLVVGVEVMIDANIDLVAIVLIVRVSIGDVRAIDAAGPAITRCIQPITDGVIVRHGHNVNERIFDEPARIVSRPQWIAPKDAE